MLDIRLIRKENILEQILILRILLLIFQISKSFRYIHSQLTKYK